MYEKHFGLSEAPFSIAPDPRYLYMSRRHREALAHLLYGIDSSGGFVLLTGDVGTGKTTVCRCLLERMPEGCEVAFIFNPKLTVDELLWTICDELRIARPENGSSVKQYIDRINAHLLATHAKGRKTLLIIDEAQNLASDVLEQIRLLTNLETNRRKLLQIILLGQPELRGMVRRPALKPLGQRIIARYHLGPLSKQEVAAYVAHRLSVAGTHRQLFSASALAKLYRLSGGVPRLINVLCDRALLGAFVERKDRVDRATLGRAAREAFGDTEWGWQQAMPRLLAAGLGALAGALALAAAFFHFGFLPVAVGARQEGAPAPIVHADEPEAASVRTIASLRSSIEPQGVSEPAARTTADSPPLADAAAVATRAAESARLDDLQWNSSEPPGRNSALAFQALFARWGIDQPAASGDACRQAQTLGLRCLAERGGLDDLRRLDRPAILQLRDGQGREALAALVALQGDTATLVVGTETKKISSNALASHWTGSYTLLWRAPPNYATLMRAGSRGPAVEWLATQLARAQNRTLEAGRPRPLFDDALAKQVREFQFSRGLAPDGVVGPRTLIHLESALAAADTPRLVGAREE